MPKNITIVTPCFNENTTIVNFLRELEFVLAQCTQEFTVVVVDDSSTDNSLELLQKYQTSAQNMELRVLGLPCNRGHQFAIYQGVLFARSIGSDRVIIIDSDGEDDPNAIFELLGFVYNEDIDIVHVVRARREENPVFLIFYTFYKILFRLLTNTPMNFGNYCMISRKVVDSILDTSFIHLAACLSAKKVPKEKIVFNRKKRIGGQSKMSLGGLCKHGVKSFVEYVHCTSGSSFGFLVMRMAMFFFAVSLFFMLSISADPFENLIVPVFAFVLIAVLIVLSLSFKYGRRAKELKPVFRLIR